MDFILRWANVLSLYVLLVYLIGNIAVKGDLPKNSAEKSDKPADRKDDVPTELKDDRSRYRSDNPSYDRRYDRSYYDRPPYDRPLYDRRYDRPYDRPYHKPHERPYDRSRYGRREYRPPYGLDDGPSYDKHEGIPHSKEDVKPLSDRENRRLYDRHEDKPSSDRAPFERREERLPYDRWNDRPRYDRQPYGRGDRPAYDRRDDRRYFGEREDRPPYERRGNRTPFRQRDDGPDERQNERLQRVREDRFTQDNKSFKSDADESSESGDDESFSAGDGRQHNRKYDRPFGRRGRPYGETKRPWVQKESVSKREVYLDAMRESVHVLQGQKNYISVLGELFKTIYSKNSNGTMMLDESMKLLNNTEKVVSNKINELMKRSVQEIAFSEMVEPLDKTFFTTLSDHWIQLKNYLLDHEPKDGRKHEHQSAVDKVGKANEEMPLEYRVVKNIMRKLQNLLNKP